MHKRYRHVKCRSCAKIYVHGTQVHEHLSMKASCTALFSFPHSNLYLRPVAACYATKELLTDQMSGTARRQHYYTFMTGVEMFLEALMISLIRGTPCVMFMLATPAKWNVFSVICVPGSPMLCAPKAPTVEPAHALNSEHALPVVATACEMSKIAH